MGGEGVDRVEGVDSLVLRTSLVEKVDGTRLLGSELAVNRMACQEPTIFKIYAKARRRPVIYLAAKPRASDFGNLRHYEKNKIAGNIPDSIHFLVFLPSGLAFGSKDFYRTR